MIFLPFKTEYKRGLPPPAEPVELGDNQSIGAVARLTPGLGRGSVPQTEEA